MNILFQKQFSSLIRFVKPSDDHSVICLEQISETITSPRYHIVDLRSFKLNAENVSVKNSKTLVLKSVTSTHLILNEYHNGKNPDHATAIAYDYKRKRIEWEKENFRILEVNGELIKAPHEHFENRLSYWDVKTGQKIEASEEKNIQSNKTESFPLLYPENSEHFGSFSKFIHEKKGHKPTICCEYLEVGKLMILSYYYFENKTLTNVLLIANSDGEILDTINLGKNLKGIGKDTFFVLENKLIFISNKNTLNIYEV